MSKHMNTSIILE